MIIGFGHRKRVGKDLACRHLRTHSANCKIYSFADKLYDICHQLYGWAGQQDKAYYEQFPEKKNVVLPAIGKTPRQITIDMGTPGIRNCVYDRTWIDYLMQNLKEPALISDVRFTNEARHIQIMGGKVIRIDRPSIPHTDDAADIDLAEFTDWDKIITNDDSPNFFTILESEILPWLTC